MPFVPLHYLFQASIPINLQANWERSKSSNTSRREKDKTRANAMSSSSSYNSPCAACKFLRRKCIPGCVFSPYFPPEDPQKFINVHKIFGASNVAKILNDVVPHQREDAVSSLAYEAEARVRDPVYGCVGVISSLQHQVDRLQKDLDVANAELIRYACDRMPVMTHFSSIQSPQRNMDHFSARRIGGGGGGGGFYQQPTPSFPYQVNREWNGWNFSNSQVNRRGGSGGNGGSGGGSGGN